MRYLNDNYSHLEKLKLDIGSGIHPKDGFIGIDNFVGIKAQAIDPKSVDKSQLNVIQWDLSQGIPFKTGSITEIVSSHFLEHCYFLDTLFEEVHRVLENEGIFDIIVPYANSAEGMYPGHNIFFTEKWFLNNITFNKLFNIQKIIFYESEYYNRYKGKINKIFSFEEARLFLFNCCNQMQILSVRKRDNICLNGKNGSDIEYISVRHEKAIKMINRALCTIFARSRILTKIGKFLSYE